MAPPSATRRRHPVAAPPPHGTALHAALIPICLVLIGGFCLGANLFIFSVASDPSAEGSSMMEVGGYAAQQRRLLSGSFCTAYADIVQAAGERPKPQLLSQAQLLWLAALVQSQEVLKARPVRFLVFGYDWLSDAFQAINCQGRTVFLESDLQQIDAVRQDHPFMEVHLVRYKGKAEEADAFFASPTMMDMPQDVDSECFDVILIDAPLGAEADGKPARLESSYYALQNARRCIEEGRLDEVLLLLHDSQRPMEQRIAKQLLLAPDASGHTSVETLGTVKDARLGDLAAFRMLPTGPSPAALLLLQQQQQKKQRGAAAFLRRLKDRPRPGQA